MARTGGKRTQPRARPPARPAPARPTLPTAADQPSGLGKKIIIAGAGLVALVVVVVVGFTLASEDQTATEQQAFLLPDVTVEGSILPPYGGTTDDPGVGLAAPEIYSTDFSGLPASIERDGVPKLILFLAHWCPACQREVPAVQAWIDGAGVPAGVDFVSVATSIDEIRPNYPPDSWLRREGWTQRVVVDSASNRIATAYGLNAFPYYVLVDGSGTVVRRISGGVSADVVGVMLEALAAGG